MKDVCEAVNARSDHSTHGRYGFNWIKETPPLSRCLRLGPLDQEEMISFNKPYLEKQGLNIHLIRYVLSLVSG